MMEDEPPTLSVIVPVYNQVPYLRRCLDSLLAQNYQDLEIICVNDGSTDDSQSILEEYAARDPRIRIVVKENGGLSSARNAGMKVMRGKYVSYIDSDDYVHPDIYTHTVQYMEDYDFVQFSAFNVEGDRIIPYDLPSEGPTKLTFEINNSIRPSVWNKLFSCELLRKYDLWFPEGLNNEDCMFSYAYRSLIDEGYFVDECLYYYVQHENSITSDFHKKPGKKNLDQLKVLVPLVEFLERTGGFERFSDQLLKMYADYAWFVYDTLRHTSKSMAISTAIHVARKINLTGIVCNSLKKRGLLFLVGKFKERFLEKYFQGALHTFR